ncbi:MAG: signal recognition particle-docking protein FtsY [Alphaproteobacteria bacterium]|nr:signal recognition particle-docking protein FtsY [Alphaproteobacteria bacterium]
MTDAGVVENRGWLKRLRAGLSKSTGALSTGVGAIFAKRKLDGDTIAELEELLIAADLGVATAAKLANAIGAVRFDGEADAHAVRRHLAGDIARILEPVAKPLSVKRSHAPHIILMVGVNGTGKTTTVGKLAHIYKDQGLSVMLAAADTFRAAAIEQLRQWGARVGVAVFADAEGTDPAAVAYRALAQAQADGVDLLLVDTAGRLHNKADLMAQLEKICRVMGKLDETAPHDCVMVLDATTGQNAHAQVETFAKMVNVTGLVVTKLDGSARGGVIVALADRFGLPIHAVGVGEGAEDLRPFEARDFANSLLDIDDAGP